MSQNNAKSAFFYFLILISLGFVTIGAGQVLFSSISSAFPESNDYGVQGLLRFGLSSVLVAAPVLWLLTRAVNSGLEKKDFSADSIVRRWLTYGILLVASIVAISDLVATLNAYLSGELSIRFALKAMTIFGISGFVLSYYSFDLRRKDFKKDWRIKTFHRAFLVAVATILVIGFTNAKSPTEMRKLRFDSERVSDLQQISYKINDFYSENEKLPAGLSELDLFESEMQDPETKNQYDYRPGEGYSYELCATFLLPLEKREDSSRWIDAEWKHPAGEHCFSRELEKWAREDKKS